MLHILETDRAPNPRRVRIFLAEKGVAATFESFDMMRGGLECDAIRSRNPWGRVPILVLPDGHAICETMAICRYVEALHPDPSLFGKTPLEIAEIEMWNRRVELNFFTHLTHIIRHGNPKMAVVENPQITAWGEANRPKLDLEIARLNDRLRDVQFIAGDTFSVADITLAIAIDFMRVARIAVPDTAPHLKAYFDRIAARPSFTA